MTAPPKDNEQALAEIRAAEAAIAAFDGSRLVREDGSSDDAAAAELARLHVRLEAAKARAVGVA